MAKDKLTDYDSTASGNLDVGGISVAEGMLPSGVNNAIREQMSHLADFASGTSGVDVLKLQDDTDTNSIKLQAPASVTATTTFTLPDGDGTADQVLKTDGSGQLGFADRHANPSLIINGAMNVAQRGTSFSSITSAVYPIDRFFVQDVNGAAGEATVSQSTTTPDDFEYSLKIDVTTADTSLVAADQYKIEHRIEGQNISHLNWGTSAAKTVTLSFWIRSNKTGNTQVALLNSANDRSYVATFTIGVANTWEKKELTVDGDTSGTWLKTNGVGLRLRWGSFGSTYQTSSTDQWIGSQAMSRDDSPINFFDSTDNELYLTGVKLEVGDTATPFDHSRSYGEELALCQRYYENAVNGLAQLSKARESDRLRNAYIPWKVTKRASPTLVVAGNSDGTDYGANVDNGTQGARVQCVGVNDGATPSVTTLTADAEL